MVGLGGEICEYDPLLQNLDADGYQSFGGSEGDSDMLENCAPDVWIRR
jgi:hypothetical protein